MLLSLPLTKIAKVIMEGFPESRWLAALLGGPKPPTPCVPEPNRAADERNADTSDRGTR
jgi:hypothetical protein